MMRYLVIFTVVATSLASGAPRIEVAPVGSGVTETTAGEKLAYVQVSSDSEPNPNPKFSAWGSVPTPLVTRIRDALRKADSKITDFPSVLIFGFKPNEKNEVATLMLGSRLDQRIAYVLLAHIETLGIKRVILSPVHEKFFIGPTKEMAGWYPDITHSIKKHFPLYNGGSKK